MFETHTSEKIQRVLSRPLINFIWYLWEVYCDPCASVSQITLEGGDGGQHFIVPSAGFSTTQDFGCRTDADIVIRRIELGYFMELG